MRINKKPHLYRGVSICFNYGMMFLTSPVGITPVFPSITPVRVD
jgi:hypothetical protein